jgi:phosphatidylglycerol lysyltransferase
MEALSHVQRNTKATLMLQRAWGERYGSQPGKRGEALELVEQLAYEYGETYDSYLAIEPDRQYFFDSGRRGVVPYCLRGRHLIAAGNLLAPPQDRESLLVELLAFAQRRHFAVTFVNVPRSHTRLFREHGFQITKWGEEPIIRLQETTWQGQDYGWVRRQENYCMRHGTEFSEVIPDPSDAVYREQIVPQLEAVSKAHIASTLHKRPLAFFEGRFAPMEMGRRRLFVARHGGRIVAFVVCNPALGGDLWAVEVYRRLPDAVRGVIPFAILKTLRVLKQEGVPYASLSLVPFLRCETAVTGDSGILRVGASFWWRHLNAVFDMRGIYHFKSRFRPDYREMYVAALPRLTVRRVLSLAAAWKLFRFNPLRLMRREWAKQGTAPERETLAAPARRPPRIVRELRRNPADSRAAKGPNAASGMSESPLPLAP